MCAIVLNFFALCAIPSNFASNGVKWIGEMSIVPLHPWATNSTFFYVYATQFSKLQHELSFTCMPLISQINMRADLLLSFFI
jgi:hypothetical protein